MWCILQKLSNHALNSVFPSFSTTSLAYSCTRTRHTVIFCPERQATPILFH
jgi:hypothetical protein